MSELISQTAVKKKNIFYRLLSGKIRLPITYWCYGCIVGNIFYFLTLAIIKITQIKLMIIPFLIYGICIGIAIWKSCDNYKGPVIWGALARFVAFSNVVIGSAMLIRIVIALLKALWIK